jgi:hypothetical protein
MCWAKRSKALSALLFLYREVLHQDLGPVNALRPKRPKRLPTVLTKVCPERSRRHETLRLISCLSGTHPQPGWLGCPQPLGFSNYRGVTWARIVIATLS